MAVIWAMVLAEDMKTSECVRGRASTWIRGNGRGKGQSYRSPSFCPEQHLDDEAI